MKTVTRYEAVNGREYRTAEQAQDADAFYLLEHLRAILALCNVHITTAEMIDDIYHVCRNQRNQLQCHVECIKKVLDHRDPEEEDGEEEDDGIPF